MTPDLEAELANYRAHRFAITRLEDGEFALFDPLGDLIAIGPIAELAPHIPTGPEHYETCAETWGHRTRGALADSGTRLLEQLGLARSAPPNASPLVRRI